MSEVREIQLNHGLTAIVDTADYDWLNRWKWSVTTLQYPYVVRRDFRCILLHRLILEAPAGRDVDHINGDQLDNRRCNLRLCNASPNGGNRRKNKRSTSMFKGVHFNPERRDGLAWVSQITVNQKKLSLGNFPTDIEAALAYDAAARKYFGEFAHPNFPEST